MAARVTLGMPRCRVLRTKATLFRLTDRAVEVNKVVMIFEPIKGEIYSLFKPILSRHRAADSTDARQGEITTTGLV